MSIIWALTCMFQHEQSNCSVERNSLLSPAQRMSNTDTEHPAPPAAGDRKGPGMSGCSGLKVRPSKLSQGTTVTAPWNTKDRVQGSFGVFSTSWEETSCAERAFAQRGDTSVQQHLPHPRVTWTARATSQLPHRQQGQQAPNPAPSRASTQLQPRVWGETAVATIKSTFCLLFLINKFCILLVMFPC